MDTSVKQIIDNYVTGWGSEVKVIVPGGKVSYQEAKSFEETKRAYHLRGRTARKEGK